MLLLVLVGTMASCACWCLAPTAPLVPSGHSLTKSFRAHGSLFEYLSNILQRMRGGLSARHPYARQSGNMHLRACEQEMAQLLDVLALGLTAGLSFDAALGLYCQKTDTWFSEVIQQTMSSWQIGLVGRFEALEALPSQIEAPGLARFCHVVCESLSFGAPLAHALEQQADVLREEQRASIQKRIEEAPVRMLLPLTTLVVPAMLLAILGPLLSSAM